MGNKARSGIGDGEKEMPLVNTHSIYTTVLSHY